MDLSLIPTMLIVVLVPAMRPGWNRRVFVPVVGVLGLAALLLVGPRPVLVAAYTLVTVFAMGIAWWVCDPVRSPLLRYRNGTA